MSKKSKTKEPAGSDAVPHNRTAAQPAQLPEDIIGLLTHIATEGVTPGNLRRLRELEPYGWTGATDSFTMKAWCEARLKGVIAAPVETTEAETEGASENAHGSVEDTEQVAEVIVDSSEAPEDPGQNP